jgi:mRNA interferase MazF
LVQADELGDATTFLLVCPTSSDLMPSAVLAPYPTLGRHLRLRSQVMTDKVSPMRRDCN